MSRKHARFNGPLLIIEVKFACFMKCKQTLTENAKSTDICIFIKMHLSRLQQVLFKPREMIVTWHWMSPAICNHFQCCSLPLSLDERATTECVYSDGQHLARVQESIYIGFSLHSCRNESV